VWGGGGREGERKGERGEGGGEKEKIVIAPSSFKREKSDIHVHCIPVLFSICTCT
jgi:hypothetical protein